jgi:hypothetical protein
VYAELSANALFPDCGRGDRILMWGTTSFCDELGGAFEARSIDGNRLFCRLAEILSHGVLGMSQHYRHEPDMPEPSDDAMANEAA